MAAPKNLERVHDESNPLMQEITNSKGWCTFSRGEPSKHYMQPVQGVTEAAYSVMRVYQELQLKFLEIGAKRYCNRCFGYDFVEYCQAKVTNQYVTRICGRPATVQLPGWDVWGRENGTQNFRDRWKGEWWCGTHNWERRKAEYEAKEAKWRAQWAARDVARKTEAERQAALDNLITASREWRKWHFTEPPCASGCEHLDCHLALAVDSLNSLS